MLMMKSKKSSQKQNKDAIQIQDKLKEGDSILMSIEGEKYLCRVKDGKWIVIKSSQ